MFLFFSVFLETAYLRLAKKKGCAYVAKVSGGQVRPQQFKSLIGAGHPESAGAKREQCKGARIWDRIVSILAASREHQNLIKHQSINFLKLANFLEFDLPPKNEGIFFP